MPVRGVKVFVSYQRRDALWPAHLVGSALDAAGHQAFVDTGSIDGGATFRDTIAQAIAGAQVLVAMVGPQFDAARLHEPGSVVAFEWQRARFHGVPVVPVLVDRAGLPPDDELPAALQWFGRRNAWPLRSATLRPDLDALVAGLPLLAGTPRPAARVLWVDDQPANNERERARLRGQGLVFDNVVSSREASEQLDDQSYDLVITDLGRARSSDRSPAAGTDFLARRQGRALPPVVVYGGLSALLQREELLALGAAAVCADPEALEQAVLALLGRGPEPAASAIVPR